MNKQLCWTQARQCNGKLMAEEVGLKKQAQDIHEGTEYRKHFRALGSAHGFVIYNGLSQWPRSDDFDILEPKQSASKVDYLAWY